MSCETKCCTFLRGELYIGDSLSNCSATSSLICATEKPLKKMGNIEGATISISSQILGTENQFHYQNNKPCTRVSVQSVDLSLTLLCTKKDNMNLGFLSKDHVGDFMVGFTQEFTVCDPTIMRECNFFMFTKSGVVLSSVSVNVYDEDSELIEPLTLGLDYSITTHGIELIRDINIEDARFIRIVYNYDDRSDTQPIDEFDFLSEFNGHKFLYFKGTNYGDLDNQEDPFGVEIYRVLFNPISQFDLISQGNYFVINLVGRIERDYTKVDEDLGGYFKIRRGKFT